MTNSLKLTNVHVVNVTEVSPLQDVLIENGKIIEISEKIEQQAQVVIDGHGQYIMPGFIDMHIHGSAGVDTMDASVEAMHTMAKSLVKEGVTGFLATTMTQKPEAIAQALRAIGQFENNADEAEVLGVHVEGPFISIKRVGAQPEEHVIAPDLQLFNEWQQLSGHKIKQITMAPEVEGGFDFVEALAKQGIVVSIGHSDATYEEVEKAVALGAKQGTHLYNQMRPFHHREPGVVGATLLLDELKAEIIADFIHSAPKSVLFAYRAKGAENLIIITDAMRAKGVPYGDYDLGGQVVHVTEAGAHLDNGALAGSVLTMDEGLRNMKAATNCTLPELVAMTSFNAATQLNLQAKGRITVGADADIVLVNEALFVQKTIKSGQVIFES